MIDLTEDTLAPEVVVRRAPSTDIDIRPGERGGPPIVGVADGAVWARAEPSSPGVDVGHGSLNVLVRSGTVLVDAQAGAGLLIVLRGQVEISTGGTFERVATAGDALTFDATGRISDPDPVDATELARDPFVSLNLVLDALGGVPIRLAVPTPTPQTTDGAAHDRPSVTRTTCSPSGVGARACSPAPSARRLGAGDAATDRQKRLAYSKPLMIVVTSDCELWVDQ